MNIQATPAAVQNTASSKKLIVISTGGTLACIADDATQYNGYGRAGKLPIEGMLNALPTLDQIDAQVYSFQFGSDGSSNYSVESLGALSMIVDEFLSAQGFDGAVIITGSDTMEEFAYMLDLTLRSSKPVVVTGSMRPAAWKNDPSPLWSVTGTDATSNLYNAMVVAASGKTFKFGPVVVMNDTIYTARDVTKTNAHRLDTFSTPVLGAIGYVDSKVVSIYRIPVRVLRQEDDWLTPFDLAAKAAVIPGKNAYSLAGKDGTAFHFPKVGIVSSYQSASGTLISAFRDAGYDGIVIAAGGSGGITPEMKAARKEAMAPPYNMAFATVTRTGSGSLTPATTPDSETGNRSLRLLAGDSLNAYHARIALILTLTFTTDAATMHDWFDHYIRMTL